MTWVPDGNLCHYIKESDLVNGKAPHKGNYQTIEVCFDVDGRLIFNVYDNISTVQGQVFRATYNSLGGAKNFCESKLI